MKLASLYLVHGVRTGVSRSPAVYFSCDTHDLSLELDTISIRQPGTAVVTFVPVGNVASFTVIPDVESVTMSAPAPERPSNIVKLVPRGKPGKQTAHVDKRGVVHVGLVS